MCTGSSQMKKMEIVSCSYVELASSSFKAWGKVKSGEKYEGNTFKMEPWQKEGGRHCQFNYVLPSV